MSDKRSLPLGLHSDIPLKATSENKREEDSSETRENHDFHEFPMFIDTNEIAIFPT